MTKKRYSKAEIAFLSRNRALVRRELHRLFVEKFGRHDISFGNLKDLCNRKKFGTGRVTCARLPGYERTKPDGFVVVRLDHTDPIRYGRNFAMKHRVLWEKKNGPIPDGYYLKCRSDDRSNCNPSNWELVDRSLMQRLRHRQYDDAPAELKPTIMAVAKLQHIAASRRK